MELKQNITTINGIEVHFPYTPYPPQVTYMSSVIECLKNSTNGLLESPTGTGKTLSLLCATLSWLWHVKNTTRLLGTPDDDNFPKIIYSSRTHSQLSHVVGEFKRTIFADLMKTCIIASRDQMCIHPVVKKESTNKAKVNMCRLKVRSRTCTYYNRVEICKSQIRGYGCMDIEDLIRKGTELTCCPYYLAKEMKESADIIFMPYNYLIDPRLRAKHGVEIKGNVLIFDEAHNLESVCEESLSFDLPSSILAGAIIELTTFMEWLERIHVENASSEESVDHKLAITANEVMQLKMKLIKLEQVIQSHELTNEKPRLVRQGSYVMDIFARAQFTRSSAHAIIALIDEKLVNPMSSTSSMNVKSKGFALSHISDALKIVFNDLASLSANQSYRVLIHHDRDFADHINSTGKTLSYWCFTADCSLKELFSQKVRSVILTSGTLDPNDLFNKSIMEKFKVQIQCGHVVSQENFSISILGKGCDGVELTSTYGNRENEAYIQSLGKTIVNLIKVIPGGVLVFFPSYTNMDYCLAQWQKTSVYKLLNNVKTIFIEPRDRSWKDSFGEKREKNKLSEVMSNYYESISNQTKGAIFMAVCRGKASEGLDFIDDFGRAVILIGLPYASFRDARVEVKMAFIDEKIAKGQGRVWYNREAIRAVNQSIGRIIRHKHDYGSIILLDKRYSNSHVRDKLPMWLKPGITEFDNFGGLLRHLGFFFRLLKSSHSISQSNKNLKFVDKVDANYQNDSQLSRFSIKSDSPVKSQTIEELPHNNTVNFQNLAVKFENIDSNKKRPRYIVKPRSTDTTCITSKYFINSQNDSEAFLSTAKKVMSPIDYEVLTTAITDYYKSNDFTVLKDKILGFMGNDVLRDHILSLRSFVKKEHHVTFDSCFGDGGRNEGELKWDCVCCGRESLAYPLRGVCSHVLCLGCWKVNERDGFLVCPVCSAKMVRAELIVLERKK